MITSKNVVIRGRVVLIKKNPMGKLPTAIGTIEKISGWWTFPRTKTHRYRDDAVAALIERWNGEAT